jgi:predicted ATPase/transcriptional regulator with XRE-family HTH domain
MLRHRSGLTQAQLAAFLGLKSARMVQNWEGEFNLPTADRLRHLIQLYLERQVFVAGKEKEEVRVLWKVVKDWFETHNFNAETYPIFDEGWFNALLTQPQTSAPADFTMFQAFRPGEGLTESAPYTLPEPIRLLGREQELARLSELLEQPGKKLLTMTGAGGSGKTSLALALGHALLGSFGGGVYLVELENVTSRESLVAEIARTLNLKEKPGQGLLQSLKDALRERHLLLILDNFEQLVAEAALVAELLKGSSRLNLVVTSRIPLQLSVEREYPVGPLSLPAKGVEGAGYEPGELVAAYPAIALFVERAHSVRPEFALSRENIPAVVEICRRLDGLPLALELAAARVRSFSPEKLLERLSLKMLTGGAKDLPARQQTLRATIEWSYSLLTSGEQRLFVRLAVFAGGCTLEAAEAVCNSEGDLDIEVFEGIDSLLTRNLLKQWEGEDGQTRYGMLVTIREFGLDKLAENGEKPLLLESFAAYYQLLNTQFEPKLISSELIEVLRWIDSEYDNILTILYQAIDKEKTDLALELARTLGRYSDDRGYLNEGLGLIEKVLALPFSPTVNNRETKAKVLRGASFLAGKLGKFAASLGYAQESLALYRELGDKLGVAHSLRTVGNQASFQGDYGQARRYCEESLAIFKDFNFTYGIAITLQDLFDICSWQGDFVASYDYAIECLALARAQGYNNFIVYALYTLAWIAIVQGDYEKGRHLLEESLAISREHGMDQRFEQIFDLAFHGFIDLFQGRYEEAKKLFIKIVPVVKETGMLFMITSVISDLGDLALNQAEYGQARTYFEEVLFLSERLDFRAGLASTRSSLGRLAYLEGNYSSAHSLLEDAVALIRKLDYNFILPLPLAILGLTALIEGKSAEAHIYLEESLALSHKMRNKLELAHCLVGFTALEVFESQKSQEPDTSPDLNLVKGAASLSGAISALLTSTGTVMFRPFPDLYEQNIAIARANLDEAAFEEAFAEGAAMSMDEVVAYALAG